MSASLARLQAFIEDWRGPLERAADVVFETAARGEVSGAGAELANGFVTSKGYASIGFHWELLDTYAKAEETRSARGAFEDALSKDLAMREDWLGAEQALRCGEQFIGAFDPLHGTILTNHIVRDGGKSEGWNPISASTYEWAFIGFDNEAIALLLLTADD